MLPNQLGKRSFRVVTPQQFSHFDCLGRRVQVRAGSGHLHTSHRVASDYREKRNGIGPDVRPELLL
jgi:hypothetical protein